MQGAPIPCSLIVKNHAATPTTLTQLVLELSLGNLKRIKSKEPDAFTRIETIDLGSDVCIAPNSQVAFGRELNLSLTAPISDKTASPYLQYGDPTGSAGLGQLLLTVRPHTHIRQVFDTMTTVFNFLNKGESHKDGRTIAKLKAPDSRRFSLVEELNLSAALESDNSMLLCFLFTVKKFDHSLAKVAVKKGKVEVTRRLDPAQYLFGGGFVRQEFIESEIEIALSEVSSGL